MGTEVLLKCKHLDLLRGLEHPVDGKSGEVFAGRVVLLASFDRNFVALH